MVLLLLFILGVKTENCGYTRQLSVLVVGVGLFPEFENPYV